MTAITNIGNYNKKRREKNKIESPTMQVRLNRIMSCLKRTEVVFPLVPKFYLCDINIFV